MKFNRGSAVALIFGFVALLSASFAEAAEAPAPILCGNLDSAKLIQDGTSAPRIRVVLSDASERIFAEGNWRASGRPSSVIEIASKEGSDHLEELQALEESLDSAKEFHMRTCVQSDESDPLGRRLATGPTDEESISEL